MSERHDGRKAGGRAAKVLARVAAAVLLVVAGLYLLVTVILATPLAAGRISRLLSDTLRQPVTVEAMHVAGGTLVIHGLTIANPAGFAGEPLLAVRSLMVTPAWGDLLRGRRSLASVRIEGPRVALSKNSTGVWNFSGLTRLAAGKKRPTETVVRRLVLEKGALTVNGRGVGDVSLTVNDLSTTGVDASGVVLAFRDEYGTPYRIAGSARLGAHPDLDLSLTASSLPFKALRGRKLSLDTEEGTGSLRLTARLHEEELRLEGNAAFDRLAVKATGGAIPLRGTIDFAGRYDMKEESATLERCAVEVNGTIRLRVRGEIEQVRKKRAFTAEISHGGVELRQILAQLPQGMRRDLLAGGTILPGVIRIAGSAAGITSGSAQISLRHGSLSKGKRVLLGDVAADAVLAKAGSGWELRGRVSQGRGGEGAAEHLDIPFTARFSDRFMLQQAEIPQLSARLSGVPVTGAASYRAAAPAPFTVRLAVLEVPVTSLARFLPGKAVALAKGTATASFAGAGRGRGDFGGDVAVRLTSLQGSSGGKKFALAEGETRARVSGSGGKLAAAGTLRLGGGVVEGKKLSVSLAYRVEDGRFTLRDGDCAVEGAVVRFAEISGPLPARVADAAGSRVPVALRFSGVSGERAGTGFTGLAGDLRLLSVADGGESWLEGNGTATVESILSGGEPLGSLSARLAVARGKGAVDLSGAVLGGKLAASASGDPFALGKGLSFSMKLDGAAAPAVGKALGKRLPVQLAEGVLAATATGDFVPQSGVRCRMALRGREISLAGKDGRTLVTGAGLRFGGEWAAGNLAVREGEVTVGDAVVALRGEVARAASAEREGELAVTLGRVPVASLMKSCANLLPRPLQGATTGGTLAAAARVRISGKLMTVEGESTVAEGTLELPAQKLSIAAVNGTLPFSIDLAGNAAAIPREKLSFSRKNYPALLAKMEQGAERGRTLAIGKMSLGTAELGETVLLIRADKGVTEVASLRSALFQGSLLGRGFFRFKGGAQYGADFLLHGVSLREVCNSFPAIKGYLSGHLDGIVSLYGAGKALNDLTGFIELWTYGVKGEKMLVSKEFLQKLAGKKFKGIFFQEDRPYDRGEIGAYLENGYLTFDTLDISHTNFLGIRDLSVTVAPVQNRIGLDHLFSAIKTAAARGKAAAGTPPPAEEPAGAEFKWEE